MVCNSGQRGQESQKAPIKVKWHFDGIPMVFSHFDLFAPSSIGLSLGGTGNYPSMSSRFLLDPTEGMLSPARRRGKQMRRGDVREGTLPWVLETRRGPVSVTGGRVADGLGKTGEHRGCGVL